MLEIISKINILDVVIIALTVLLLLFGIWRGMYKMLHGLVSSVLALVIAIMLTSTVVTFVIDNTLLDDKLVDVIASPLSQFVPNSQQVLAFYDVDGDPETPDELGYNPGSGIKTYDELFKDSKYSFIAPLVKPLLVSHITKYGETPFLSALTAVITAYILSAAAFIVLWILMFIVVSLLFFILKKVVSSTYIGYYLNKIVGGVLGLAVSAFLIFGFLTVVKLIGNYEQAIPINQMIENSAVAKLLANNNFLYTFISSQLDVQSLIDKIMAMIAKTGLQ